VQRGEWEDREGKQGVERGGEEKEVEGRGREERKGQGSRGTPYESVNFP